MIVAILRAASAAFLYFLLVFAAGFLFGTVRELFVARWLDPELSRILETPFMLAITWLAAARVVQLRAVPEDAANRLGMGIPAFLLLLAAEFALGVYGFGMSAPALLRQFLTPLGLFTLAAQSMVAVFPLVVSRSRVPHHA